MYNIFEVKFNVDTITTKGISLLFWIPFIEKIKFILRFSIGILSKTSRIYIHFNPKKDQISFQNIKKVLD
ncbi:hypothetical protein DHD08_02600 [Arenibacter sp. H213]|nr:hypothetical protein [Arenibacter sp. H213]